MEGFVSKVFVEVLLDQNLARPLDYAVPQEWSDSIQIGMRVEVPLKSTFKQGTISKIKPESLWENCKPLAKLLSHQSEMSNTQWKLAEWMAKYYAAPLQRVLKLFVPANIRKEIKQKTQIFLQLNQSHNDTIKHIETLRLKNPNQAGALEEILNAPKGLFLKDLNAPKSTINSLVKKKLISSKNITNDDDLLLEEEFFKTLPKKLNEEKKL